MLNPFFKKKENQKGIMKGVNQTPDLKLREENTNLFEDLFAKKGVYTAKYQNIANSFIDKETTTER